MIARAAREKVIARGVVARIDRGRASVQTPLARVELEADGDLVEARVVEIVRREEIDGTVRTFAREAS